MSTQARLSTVYDLASLRLHPDGTRVQQSSTNLKPRISTTAVRDARGNWIARDAGGSIAVPKYKKVRQKKSVEWSEASGGEQEEVPDEGQVVDEDKEGKKKRKGKRKDLRPAKRQKFAQDYTYLDNEMHGAQDISLPDVSHEQSNSAVDAQLKAPLPPPSSELLKCIHHFTATYYAERGQLLNASREFRQQQKERRHTKLAKKQQWENEGVYDPNVSMQGTSKFGSNDHENEEDDEQEEEGEEEKPQSGRKRGWIKKQYPLDMYKVFDGSALMVIAMLVQEHVAHLLEPRIPDGWEEEVREAYANGVGEDDDEDADSGMEDNGNDVRMREQVSDEMEDEEGADSETDEDDTDENEGEEWDEDEDEVQRQTLAAEETEEETLLPLSEMIEDEDMGLRGNSFHIINQPTSEDIDQLDESE